MIRRDKGDTLSLLVQFLLKLRVPCAPHVCVCVVIPFILDVRFVGVSAGVTLEEGHTRIFHPPSFCGACLHFSREKGSGVPFPR